MKHSCGLLKDDGPDSDKYRVIIAGGFDGSNSGSSAQVFQYGTQGLFTTWTDLQPMPMNLHGAFVVSNSDCKTLYFLGGKSTEPYVKGSVNSVLRFDGSEWFQEEESLPVPKADFAVIPFQYPNCI